jgi:hypothetical protein
MAQVTLSEVERLAMQLTQSEQLRLLEDVARRLPQSGGDRVPRDLYGDWRAKFPVDFDIDAALTQARGHWSAELDQL